LFLRNEFGELPLSSFGTGVQQLLYLIFKIAEVRPKILLIEEIELNLSPKYQDVLIKYFETLIAAGQIVNQAFITSHSPLHCYRTQHRSYLAKINGSAETAFEKFILPETEVKKLKAAHVFLVRSSYGITVKKEL
jgi:predicted ATP-binding protein involved in virulence